MRVFASLLVLLSATTLFAQRDSSERPMPVREREEWPASEGRIRFRQDGRFGFLLADPASATTLPWVAARFDQASDFREGKARVGSQGKEGFLDLRGELSIPLQFERVWSFQDSVAMARLEGRYGFLNHEGTWVLPPQFDHAQVSSENMLLVRKDGLYGFYSTKGELMIPLMYEEARPFFQGKALVKLGDASFYIDRSGRCIEGCE